MCQPLYWISMGTWRWTCSPRSGDFFYLGAWTPFLELKCRTNKKLQELLWLSSFVSLPSSTCPAFLKKKKHSFFLKHSTTVITISSAVRTGSHTHISEFPKCQQGAYYIYQARPPEALNPFENARVINTKQHSRSDPAISMTVSPFAFNRKHPCAFPVFSHGTRFMVANLKKIPSYLILKCATYSARLPEIPRVCKFERVPSIQKQ